MRNLPFNFLLAGRYTINIQSVGFKQFNQTDLLLDARQVLRVDAAMQVGQVGETVTIQGGAAVINTETPTIAPIGRFGSAGVGLLVGPGVVNLSIGF